MNEVPESGYHSCFDENNEWCVEEVIKIENKTNFHLNKTKKVIVMTREDEDDFKNSTLCWFCEISLDGRGVRDPCHLTGKYRETAHEKCNKNVKQKQ